VKELNVLGHPDGVANCLHRYRWEPSLGSCGRLTLPSYYARLFSYHFGEMSSIAGLKWQLEEADGTCILLFESLSSTEQSQIEEFLDVFRRVVVIGQNEFIRQEFTDELAFALALDLNYLDNEHRTPIGQLEFRAKWQQSVDALRVLANHLLSASRWLPIDPSEEPVCLMGVPQYVRTPYRLPQALATAMASAANQNQVIGHSFELLKPSLSCRKPGLKELSLRQKLACWDDLAGSEKIVLSATVEHRTVLIIDDLYQSGVTMWSMARFLKQQGAAKVIGLTCVKSIRDTDNL